MLGHILSRRIREVADDQEPVAGEAAGPDRAHDRAQQGRPASSETGALRREANRGRLPAARRQLNRDHGHRTRLRRRGDALRESGGDHRARRPVGVTLYVAQLHEGEAALAHSPPDLRAAAARATVATGRARQRPVRWPVQVGELRPVAVGFYFGKVKGAAFKMALCGNEFTGDCIDERPDLDPEAMGPPAKGQKPTKDPKISGTRSRRRGIGATRPTIYPSTSPRKVRLSSISRAAASKT